ncbi:unnamed protein product [Symbiodinium natans]|uniref:Reverse transcriptase domain-containing protein n=1 Tax=Symbiodinium natans TaxID=878477 RepID=A0A812KH07_9DINO|nr:unnamed protein product [Symbiodinium natans]
MIRRAWTCSRCQRGVEDTQLPYHVLHAAARAHLRVCVGPKFTMAQNFAKCVSMKLTRQSFGAVNCARTARRRARLGQLSMAGKNDHQVVEVLCPRVEGSSTVTWLSCQRCTRFFTHVGQVQGGSCRPHARKAILRRKHCLWRHLRLHHNGRIGGLAQAWRLSLTEARLLEGLAEKKYKKAWRQVTPLQSCSWLRDLCADGDVEPHPGPLRAGLLNVNGMAGAYRALGTFDRLRCGFVVLLETQANRHQHAQLQKALQKKGYRTFGFPGREGRDVRGRPFVRGGLLVGVLGHIRARCVRTHCSLQGDLLTFDFFSCFMAVGWQREAGLSQGGLGDELAISRHLAVERGVPWSAMCDWNVTPSDNVHVQHDGLEWLAPCDSQGLPLPSRFGSTRCIDYVVHEHPSPWTTVKFGSEAISDHKVLVFQGAFPAYRECVAYMRPTPRYGCPSSYSKKQWQDLLAQCWARRDHPVPRGEPDAEWDAFCCVVEDVLREASDAADTRVNSMATRPKGSRPSLMKQGEYCKLVHTPHSFKARQLEKLLARLHEAQRQRMCGGCDPRLEAAIERTWPPEFQPFVDYASAVDVVKAELQQLRDTEMRRRVSSWKRRLSQGGSEATRWLKAQTTVAPHTLLVKPSEAGLQPRIAASTAEFFRELRAFWGEIWDRADLPEELQRLREGQLSRPHGAPIEGDWRISPCEFREALKAKAHGAAGCDGWRPEELLPLPLDTWHCFLTLWHDWCERDAFPSALQHAKQVFLPKTEVIDGVAAVDALRPICVQPVLCRAISSCMASRSQSWMLSKVRADTLGALRGRSVEAAVLALDAAFQQDSILMSLDLYKCFDLVSPELAIGLLEHEGLHPQWARHLRHMWCKQMRWLQIGAWTDPSPAEVNNSVPQGCAMAPLALVCLLLEATSDVANTAADHTFCQTVFVDDRALVAVEPAVAVGAWRCWESWCARLGLRENVKKLCVLCSDSQKRAELVRLGVPVQSFADEARVLGVDFQTADCEDLASASHDQRVAVAEGILQRLARLPVSNSIKRMLFRTRASPLLTWGVWFQADDAALDFKLTTRIKRIVGQVTTMGSRHLWQLLEGHWTSPAFAASVAAVASFLRARHYWLQHHVLLRPGRWLRRVCAVFGDADFTPVRPTLWRHPALGRVSWTEPTCRLAIGRVVHALREAHRRRLFDLFLARDRRDSRLLQHVNYDEQQVRAASRLYAQAGGHQRAVMHGAALSTAVYGVIRDGFAPPRCEWCMQWVVPSWEHLVWNCAFFSRGRPPRPALPLRGRLGWPWRTVTRQARSVLDFMAGVRKQLLDVHGFHVEA